VRRIRSRTAAAGLVAVVAVLTIALGTWQGWLAQAQGTTYIVNDVGSPEPECGTPDFTTPDVNSVIALPQVHDGDTLVLCQGTYDGAITVNKKLTIEGQEGVDRAKIVIRLLAAGTFGLTVDADDVTIRHLRLRGPCCGFPGIEVVGNNATISDVEVTQWRVGIVVNGASDTVIEDSIIAGNEPDGIVLQHTSGSHIARNSIAYNRDRGLDIDNADLAVVEDNTIMGSGIYGGYQMRIWGRSHVQVLRNTIVTGIPTGDGGPTSNGGISLGLPAEALVVIGGSDANANTFEGDLTTNMYYISLGCGWEATVNAAHNYWKGAPAISRGVAGVIFNDESDDPANPGADCPGDNKGAVVFHPVATGPAAPTPSPTVTPTPGKRTFDLYTGWNNFVWTGPTGADAATVLSCIDGYYSIAYYWSAGQGKWLRYVPGRCAEVGMCTLANVSKYDSLLVLVTGSGAVCTMPVDP